MVNSSNDDIPTIKSGRSREMAALKCPFIYRWSSDLCKNAEIKTAEEMRHHLIAEHSELQIVSELLSREIAADMIPRSEIEVMIKELAEIRDTINRASKNESWATVTSAWQLTQNMIWKLKELLEK